MFDQCLSGSPLNFNDIVLFKFYSVDSELGLLHTVYIWTAKQLVRSCGAVRSTASKLQVCSLNADQL